MRPRPAAAHSAQLVDLGLLAADDDDTRVHQAHRALYSALGRYGRPPSTAGRRNAVTVLRRPAKEAQSKGMNIEEDDLVRPVRDVGDRLGCVHIGENHRGHLGSGHLDFG